MELDMTKIMIQLQKKYNAIREIDRLTKEMSDAFARNDEVSAAMLMEMRGDEMAKVDACVEALWQEGKSDAALLRKLRVLLTSDPKKASGETPEEEKIYEIRFKTQSLLDGLKKADERLNRSVTREKSFYGLEEKKHPVSV